jgi:hypothetical protein
MVGPIWSGPALFVGRSVHWNLDNGLPVMEATAKRQGSGDDGEHDDDAHDLILYLHMILVTRDLRHHILIRLGKG